MSEEAKTYVFDGGGSNIISALAPMLSQRGIDPSVLALMKNDEFGGSAFIWVIFLFFLMGWGGNGFGPGRGFGDQVNNDFGRDLLMQAINGNRTAVSELATNLNCSVGAIQGAISALGTSVQSVGNSVGMSGMQVVNAIQSGNADLASKLSSCCCENRLEDIKNTSLIADKIAAQTTLISDKFCELEKRELSNKITDLTAANTALRGQIDNANQTASITGYVNAALAPIIADVTAIKAATPSTVAVPWPQLQAVPATPATAGVYGYPYGYNYGTWA